MESKPKARRVRKARSVILEPQKLEVKQAKSPEELIRSNGDMIEELFASRAWVEIVQPLILESIAGVSGRFTNGRFHKGDLTRSGSFSLEKLSGYQTALEDLHNNLADFIAARDKFLAEKKREAQDEKAPVYNPFMEEESSE